MRRLVTAVAWLCLPVFVLGFPSGRGYARTYHEYRRHRSYRSHRARGYPVRHYAYRRRFSRRRRIHRSAKARYDFMRDTGFAHGRKGYVVDHIEPLACGGADAPSNMQWQTKADAKAKDKWERKGCRK